MCARRAQGAGQQNTKKANKNNNIGKKEPFETIRERPAPPARRGLGFFARVLIISRGVSQH
jgi:hypothetical protein